MLKGRSKENEKDRAEKDDWKEKRMNGWMDGWMDGWMNE